MMTNRQNLDGPNLHPWRAKKLMGTEYMRYAQIYYQPDILHSFLSLSLLSLLLRLL